MLSVEMVFFVDSELGFGVFEVGGARVGRQKRVFFLLELDAVSVGKHALVDCVRVQVGEQRLLSVLGLPVHAFVGQLLDELDDFVDLGLLGTFLGLLRVPLGEGRFEENFVVQRGTGVFLGLYRVPEQRPLLLKLDKLVLEFL